MPPSLPTFARWRRARLWSLLLLIPVGVLAGVWFGAAFSITFAIYVAATSRFDCPYRNSMRELEDRD